MYKMSCAVIETGSHSTVSTFRLVMGDSKEPVLREADLVRHEIGLELVREELDGTVVLIGRGLQGKQLYTSKFKILRIKKREYRDGKETRLGWS